jgi:hypothetical protein
MFLPNMPLNKQNKKQKLKQQKAKKRLPQTRKAAMRARGLNRRSNPVGPNPMSVIRGRGGRLGLGGNPQSGITSRYAQTIEEDEYIADVNGSSAFATTAYSINPGNVTTFPWGSRIAQLYDEYDFTFLEFYYQRIASEFNTSASTGEVILSIDYNASDPVPTTLQQVLATRTKNKGMPCDQTIPLQADCVLIRQQPSKYVLSGALPANTDSKTYNAGTLYVSTQGTGTSNTLGRLFVRYRCVLKEPILEPATVAGGVVHFSSIAATTANNFAASAQQAGGTPSLTGITLGTNTVNFPAGIPGNYLLALTVAGATSATALAAVVDTPLNILSQGAVRDTVGNVQSLAGTTSSPAMQLITCTIGVAASTVTITASTITGTGTMDLFVVGLPSTVLTQPVLPPTAREQGLLMRMERLERLLEKDSEFEEEECKHDHVQSGSSSSSGSRSGLTSSTVDLIGELLTRKTQLSK